MNKAELVDAMATIGGITKVQAQSALDAFFTATEGALKKGDKLSLVGFGTFSVNERAARKGRNPQTGAEINIPAKKAIRFKASSSLETQIK